MRGELYDFPPPSHHNDDPGDAYTYIAECRHGCSHPVGKSSVSQWHSPARPFPFLSTGGAIHHSAYLLAHIGNSGVGVILSLEILSNLGSSFLFLGGRLFHSRLRRSFSKANVANDGPG